MVIRNNLNAMNSHNNLARNVLGTRRASERLSSGFRINRAADDAAGLAVSESMRSQLRGLGQAIRNANDGISLLQTAEGALEETHAMLHRLQELSVQAANDTYNNTDRAQIQREVNELLQEISRIATETNFNGVRLFNGTRGTNFAVDAGGFTVSGASSAVGAAAPASVADAQNTINAIRALLNAGFSNTSTPNTISDMLDGGSGSDPFDLVNAAIADLRDHALTLNGAAADIATTDAAEVSALANWAVGLGMVRGNSTDSEMVARLAAALEDGGAVRTFADTAALVTFVAGTADQDLKNILATVASGSGTGGGAGGPTWASESTALITLVQGAHADFSSETGTSVVDLATNLAGTGTAAGFAALHGALGATGAAWGAGTTAAAIEGALNAWIAARPAPAPGGAAPAGGGGMDMARNSLGLAVDGNGNTVVWNSGQSGAAGMPVGANHLGTGALDIPGAGFLQYQSLGYGATQRDDDWFDSAHADVVGGVTLQIGTNAAVSQRLVLNFGDMTTTGLGLANLDLTSLRGAQVALGIQSDDDRIVAQGAPSDPGPGTATLSDSSSQRFVGPFPPGSVQFAINLVNGQRAQLGAWQNRLESTVSNLTTTHENLTAAESGIRDADMAAEMIQFTKFNILQQSAQAMLAQANQAPQAILQLLR
jgi:flagellin